ncbi:MAG: hypothetical protein LBU83_03900 [Bacteroidales bacterium]|jgi:hypothetical protein|nr:hypothetical protein [Bacteroidales bacterium]
MKNQQRINWKQGMEITPEIFIESDEYHIAERQLLGTLLASRLNGIFPESKLKIDYELHNNQIEIWISNCIALTSCGNVIQIQNKTSFNKELPVDDIEECYVVLSENSENKQVDENELHIIPKYDISFKKTDDSVGNGIPVLKLFRKTAAWEVDAPYIPPSIALNSVDSLLNKYIEIKKVIHRILHYFTENDSNYLLAMLLQIELNNFSPKESPELFTQLMKKFYLIFQTNLKIVKEIESLQSIKKFTDMFYNHYEIEKILNTGYASFTEMLKILEVEPIPEIEEIKV